MKFKKFEDIGVSTMTFTATSNSIFNISRLFNELPITKYTPVKKKRGRKKKNEQQVDTSKKLSFGSIITLKYQDKIRGIDLKSKSKNKKKPKWFRNSITVVIMIDKFINFKICKNGTFQMTGCKSKKHAIECVKIVWKLIKDKDLYTFKSDDTFFKCIFIPSMRNIDFNLGFTVDREKFNKYMSEQEEFRCLLETSFGYTGLNIKLLLENDINNMKTTVLEYKAAPRRGGSAAKEDFYLKQSTYKEYLKLLTKKERKTKLETKRYHTFLVFHSGSCIFSGLTEEFMKPVYETFVKIIRKARPHIEERLDTT